MSGARCAPLSRIPDSRPEDPGSWPTGRREKSDRRANLRPRAAARGRASAPPQDGTPVAKPKSDGRAVPRTPTAHLHRFPHDHTIPAQQTPPSPSHPPRPRHRGSFSRSGTQGASRQLSDADQRCAPGASEEAWPGGADGRGGAFSVAGGIVPSLVWRQLVDGARRVARTPVPRRHGMPRTGESRRGVLAGRWCSTTILTPRPCISCHPERGCRVGGPPRSDLLGGENY